MKNKSALEDLNVEQKCMTECVTAFEKMARHYCDLDDNDSVARNQGVAAKLRVLQWVAAYLQEHKWF